LDAAPKTVACDSNCQLNLGDASRLQNHFSEIGEDGQISSPLDEKTLSKKENFWGICLLAEIFTFTFSFLIYF
jgi:hypothetical protein